MISILKFLSENVPVQFNQPGYVQTAPGVWNPVHTVAPQVQFNQPGYVQTAPGVWNPAHTVPGVAVAPPVQQPVVQVPSVQQVVPQQSIVQAPQVAKNSIQSNDASVVKRIKVSDNDYQRNLTKAFNKFRQETGRLPQVAGKDNQSGIINPIDQQRIDSLYKQHSTAGVPSSTAKKVTNATIETGQIKPKDLSGSEAAGIAAKKGAQAVGDAVGSAGKKVAELAGEHPALAGAGVAAAALGLRKILRRDKQST